MNYKGMATTASQFSFTSNVHNVFFAKKNGHIPWEEEQGNFKTLKDFKMISKKEFKTKVREI